MYFNNRNINRIEKLTQNYKYKKICFWMKSNKVCKGALTCITEMFIECSNSKLSNFNKINSQFIGNLYEMIKIKGQIANKMQKSVNQQIKLIEGLTSNKGIVLSLFAGT